MPTTRVSAGSGLQLQEVADIVGKSKKVVVVTGAGISTNCGIPVSWAQAALQPRMDICLRSSRTSALNMACTP